MGGDSGNTDEVVEEGGEGAAGDEPAAAASKHSLSASPLSSRVFLATGTFTALVEIAKHGHRDMLVGLLGDALSKVLGVVSTLEESCGAGVEGGRGKDGSGGSIDSAGASALLGQRLRGSPLLRKL